VKRAVLLLAVLVVPASNAAPLGGEPVALVTAEAENRLLVVDLSSGDVIQRLRMPADPENVETTPTNDAAAVVSTRAGAVTLLALPRLRVRRTLTGFGSPHIAAFAPNGRYLYVTDDPRGQLVTIGLRRWRIVSRTFVGFGAHHMSFWPGHHELWIVLGERARTIAIVDTTYPSRPRRKGSFSPGGLVHDLAFAPGGRRVWIAYDDRSSVGVFDVRTRRLLASVPAGTPPQHVAFGRYAYLGRHAYVTSGSEGRLRIFSPRGRLLGVARTPVGSFNLSIGGAVVLTSSLSAGTLTQLHASGRRIWTRRVAPTARDAAFAVLP
jgi:DNA-binding beta-propeller fold protein YncE